MDLSLHFGIKTFVICVAGPMTSYMVFKFEDVLCRVIAFGTSPSLVSVYRCITTGNNRMTPKNTGDFPIDASIPD